MADEDDPPILLHVQPTEMCSPHLRRFLKRHHEIFDLFFFSLFLARRADDARSTAAKALAVGGRPEDQERLRLVEADPNPSLDKLNRFAGLQQENITIRLVDNFLCLLSDIIQAAISKRPQILMSEETIRVEDVLRFTRYSDLVSFLIEKKINNLSYGSIRDIEKFCRKRTGLSMFETDSQRTLLMASIELRNIYTHARGVVSETTMRKLANLDHKWDFKPGERFNVGYDGIVDLSNNLLEVARYIDLNFSRKFGMKRKRYERYDDAN